MAITRRSLLHAGGGLTAAAALGAAAGCSSEAKPKAKPKTKTKPTFEPPVPPAAPAGKTVEGVMLSPKAPGLSIGWTVTRPHGVPDGQRLPVVIVLHGLGGDRHAFRNTAMLPAYLTDYVDRGGEPFAVATMDAFASWYHPRTTGGEAGSDFAAVVTDTLIPTLALRKDLRLETERVGLYGFSMGGYGALRIAGLLGPKRVFAVVASSPALFDVWEDVKYAAFEDEDAFDEYGTTFRQAELRDIPVRIECGEDDEFAEATRHYMSGLLTAPEGGIFPGRHDAQFTMKHLPDALDFLGKWASAPH